MFLEDEEWNDEPDAQALSNTVLSVKSDNITNIKSRGIRGVRKKNLMRTLQALGTVPDWKSDAPQDGSDSEGETVSLPSEKKKKRRRRRRKSDGEEEGKNDLEVGGQEKKTVSKKSKNNKSGSSEAKNTDEVTDDSKEIETAVKTEEQNTDKLSRKHWKNKMKNKKKCTNKYRPNNPKQESIKAAIPGQHNPEEQQNMNSGSNSNEKTPAQPKKTQCKPQKRKNLEKQNTKTPREDNQVISVEKLKKGIDAKKSSVQDSNHEAGERQGGIEEEQQASPSKRLKLELSKKQVLKKQKLQQKVISDSNSNEKTLSETPAQQKKTQNKPQKKKNIEKALPSTKTPREDKQVMISLKQGIDAKKSPVQDSNHEAGERQGGIEDEQQASPGKKIKLELSNEQVLKRQKLKRLLQGHGPDKEENPTEQKDEKEPEATQAKADIMEAPVDHSTSLRARMEQRLEAARFRYINEVLYTTSSGEAKRMFKQDPAAFDVYHRGFTNQVQRWPSNPVDDIIKFIQKKPLSQVVADFGCGDCKIARSVKNKVHSFDLVPICDLVTVCDMAKVPLEDNTVDIAVFCLSLMGTNLHDFLSEANRVLVKGGVLKIAEVASRFDNVRSFLNALASFGFKVVSKDTENTHFYTFDLVKTGDAPANIKKLRLELKACVYKKR